MYAILCRIFPRRVAVVLTAMVWTLLLLLIYALSVGPEGDFRYFRI